MALLETGSTWRGRHFVANVAGISESCFPLNSPGEPALSNHQKVEGREPLGPPRNKDLSLLCPALGFGVSLVCLAISIG